MNCYVEWIRNFLLRNSTIPSNLASKFGDNFTKKSLFNELSSYRYQLLKPGFSSFIEHRFYSLTISIIDSNFSYENSNFSIIRTYLSHFLPNVNISINELESKSFTTSHQTLCKSILVYYIRFYLKPSSISPTCYGSDIETYEKALYEWGRSVCKSEIPYLPGNFMIDFGTAQVVSIILSKIHPELIQLNRITFSRRLNQSEISRNWREVGTALSVIGVHVPTEKEWGNNLCLLCFGVDLFRSIYNKSNSSNIEYQMQQNQTAQQKCYENFNNDNNYCANNEISKIDFLISQMNSISNGNPNVLLSGSLQQNPILVQQQRALQQQQHQQQILQLMQDQHQQPQIEQLNTITFDQPEPIQNESRVKIVSNRKPTLNSYHCESKKQPIPKSQINDELIRLRAEKYKLLKENKQLEKSHNHKKIKKSNENPKQETIQNFKIMSSFAIDPSFPNQCVLTTSKELISKNQNDDNQFKTLKTLEKQRKKKKNKNESNNSPNSSIKCSYVTFENNNNQIESKSQQNQHKHKYKTNSLFDDVLEAEKPDFQDPKSSQDFQIIIKKQKAEAFKEDKKKTQLDGSKSGAELLDSINSFIEQQRQAIAAASLSQKVETHSKQNIQKKLPDFSQIDPSNPESFKVFDNDPVLLADQKLRAQKSDKNEISSDSSAGKESRRKGGSFDPLVAVEGDPFRSSSSSASEKKARRGRGSGKVQEAKPKGDSPGDGSSAAGKEPGARRADGQYDPFESSKSSSGQDSLEPGKRRRQDPFEDESSGGRQGSSGLEKEGRHGSLKDESSGGRQGSSGLEKEGRHGSLKDESSGGRQGSSGLEKEARSDSLKEESSGGRQGSRTPKFDHRSDSFKDESSSGRLGSRSQGREDRSDSFKDESSAGRQGSREPEDRSDSFEDGGAAVKNVSRTTRRSDSFESLRSSSRQGSFESDGGSAQGSGEGQEHQTEPSTSAPASHGEPPSAEQGEQAPPASPRPDSPEPGASLPLPGSSDSAPPEGGGSTRISKSGAELLEIEEEESPSQLDSPPPGLPAPNPSASAAFSQIKNSSKMDDFSMRSELTFPDIPSLIDQSFRLSQTSEKVHDSLQSSEKAPTQSIEKVHDSFQSSEKVPQNKVHLSDTEKKPSPKKRPIPLPPATNFSSSGSKLQILPKANSQKSESLTPAELSIVSSLDAESANPKGGLDASRTLNDDNELSIDQNSSEIKTHTKNTDTKVGHPKFSDNSQSSAKVESAVEDFIPELERHSSGNDVQKSSKNSSSEKDDHPQFKKFHSSSSSSDSIPFKVISAPDESSRKPGEFHANDESNHRHTSVIEEFDLNSLKSTQKVANKIQSISGPILLKEEPVPRGDRLNKGPSSDVRRVSFSLGAKGFHSSSRSQRINGSSTSASQNTDDADIDTFMSTASLSHSVSIPVEERLNMYSKSHNELSLSMSESELPAVVREYRDEAAANVARRYIWLADDEQEMLERALPEAAAAGEAEDVKTIVAKKLRMQKNSSTVNRVAANIRTFLASRGKQK